MTNRECDVIDELEDLLDIAEDANMELAMENDDLKDLLIGTLLELGEYKDAYIEELEDVLFGDEEFCPDCGEFIQ